MDNKEHMLRLAELAEKSSAHIATLYARIGLLEERIAVLIETLKKNGLLE